jgi:hypothetical protein
LQKNDNLPNNNLPNNDDPGKVGKSAAVDVLLSVKGGEHDRLVVNFGGVLVDRGCGLSAKVAVARVEVEGADVVGTMGAGEPHASLDAGDGVKALHSSECSPLAREG